MGGDVEVEVEGAAVGDMRTAVSGGALRWHVALTMKMSTIDASPPPSSEYL